jgi:hypothetical protein
MKTTIKLVHIALHFAEMTVLELLNFAKGIKLKIATDPDVTIDAGVQTALGSQITALDNTVTARQTDKSQTLTNLEADQASKVIITLATIAHTTEDTANSIAAGDTAAATTIITRIGFQVADAASHPGRTFEVYETAPKKAKVHSPAMERGTIYHRRWSQNQQLWHRVKDTTEASVTFDNLPGGGTIYFQMATTAPAGRNPVLDANISEPNWGDSIHAVIPS